MTPLTVAAALRHLDKAHEYLRAAQRSLDDGDLDAAGGNAILAGINAADCVSGAVQGTRWNVTVYDANYVALAEALEARLLTADQRLARGVEGIAECGVVALGS